MNITHILFVVCSSSFLKSFFSSFRLSLASFFNYFTFTLFSDVLLPTSEQPSLWHFSLFFIITPLLCVYIFCTLLIGHQH